MGVYGDHAKLGGWNEILVDASMARKRAREEYTPASNELAFVADWIELGRPLRAQHRIQNGGLLAAAEALIRHGVEINGWQSDWAEYEYRRFYDSQTIDFAGRIALKEATEQGVSVDWGYQDEGPGILEFEDDEWNDGLDE